jgi:nucleotide-binding universal stress UspA family protein
MLILFRTQNCDCIPFGTLAVTPITAAGHIWVDHGIARPEEGAMLSPVVQRLIRFDKLAVLTDLGEDSEKMLRYAASLARWYGSKLALVHACIPELPAIPPEPLPNWPVNGARSKECAEEKLKTLTLKLGLQDLEPKCIVRESGIGLLLADLTEYRPDLLVLATHGREGIRKWLLGSVTEGVFRKVQWPVLVLGPHCDAKDHAEQLQLRSIVYATDLSGISVTALQYAAGLAQDHDAQLVALHVEPNNGQGFTFDRVMSLQRLQDWLHDRIDGLSYALRGVEYAVEFGRPAASIVEVAGLRHADLLVVGARGLGAVSGPASHFLGGTAYDVICSAKCPVLVVPQPR